MQAHVCAAAKELRPYQVAAVSQVDQKIAAGSTSVLVVAPPGAGKTVIALQLTKRALARGQRVLFVAHRRELITQASKTFDDAGIDHGVVMAGHWRHRPTLPVQIGTIQTLTRRRDNGINPEVVLIDEAHLAVAPRYMNLIKSAYPDAAYLGFTGTPERLDQLGLSALFQDLVNVVTAKALVDEGYLVDPIIYAPKEQLDLSGVRTMAGDYSDQQLDQLCNTIQLCGDLVEHWKRHADGASTIVFAVNQNHSRRIAAQFKTSGIAAEHVDCHTPKPERDAVLARLRSGETLVVTNVDILTEGFDFPALQCVVLARPTKSRTRYKQAVGRVMRPAPGKKTALCLDHAGCVHEHGFPTDPDDVALDGSNGDIESCPGCNALLRAAASCCSACGWVRPPVRVKKSDKTASEPAPLPANNAGELHRLDPKTRPQCPSCHGYQVKVFQNATIGSFTIGIVCSARSCAKTVYMPDAQAIAIATDQQKIAEFGRLYRMQCARGLPSYWATWKFKQTFGHAPYPRV